MDSSSTDYIHTAINLIFIDKLITSPLHLQFYKSDGVLGLGLGLGLGPVELGEAPDRADQLPSLARCWGWGWGWSYGRGQGYGQVGVGVWVWEGGSVGVGVWGGEGVDLGFLVSIICSSARG